MIAIFRCWVPFLFLFFALKSAADVSSLSELRAALSRGDQVIVISAGAEIVVPQGESPLRVTEATNIIRGAWVGPKPQIIAQDGNKPLFQVLPGANNVTFNNLFLQGHPTAVKPNHAAILANNISGVIVKNSVIRSFNHGVFAAGEIDKLGNWLIENNLFENIRRKSIAFNRRVDQGALLGPIVVRNNIIRRDARDPASLYHSESRAVAFDGGNVGETVIDLRGTLIEGNTIENLSLAFSRVKNMTIGAGNKFIANTVTFSDIIHVEELSKNIRIVDNSFEPGSANPRQSLINLIGSEDISVMRNSVTKPNSVATRFVTTRRYMNGLRIVNNNLSGLEITHGAKQIISIQSCGGNKVDISRNKWKTELGYKAYVGLGTFFWNDFDDLVLPKRSIEDLSQIEASNQSLFNGIASEINENLYYTCPNSDCRGVQGTVGSFTGESTAEQPVITRAVPACGPERNFFGGLIRKFGYQGWVPTF